MKKSEVIDLFEVLLHAYPRFDTSQDNLAFHHMYLQDFPFDEAMKNVDQHIMTSQFPPTIADIRGRLGDQVERDRSKREAEEYMANMDTYLANGTPPPEGYWESLRRMIRGDVE